jgi:hypothetical protein
MKDRAALGDDLLKVVNRRREAGKEHRYVDAAPPVEALTLKDCAEACSVTTEELGTQYLSSNTLLRISCAFTALTSPYHVAFTENGVANKRPVVGVDGQSGGAKAIEKAIKQNGGDAVSTLCGAHLLAAHLRSGFGSDRKCTDILRQLIQSSCREDAMALLRQTTEEHLQYLYKLARSADRELYEPHGDATTVPTEPDLFGVRARAIIDRMCAYISDWGTTRNATTAETAIGAITKQGAERWRHDCPRKGTLKEDTIRRVQDSESCRLEKDQEVAENNLRKAFYIHGQENMTTAEMCAARGASTACYTLSAHERTSRETARSLVQSKVSQIYQVDPTDTDLSAGTTTADLQPDTKILNVLIRGDNLDSSQSFNDEQHILGMLTSEAAAETTAGRLTCSCRYVMRTGGKPCIGAILADNEGLGFNRFGGEQAPVPPVHRIC